MELKEIVNKIAIIHNILADIYVKGDNVIKLANAIQMSRDLTFALQDELNNKDDDSE